MTGRAAGRPVPAPHLALVGLMGAGKSTVGAEVARRMDAPLVDVDAEVIAAAGMEIAAIFAVEGEAGFRSRERAALAAACATPVPVVIACGGGAVLDAANRRVLRERAVVVWLTAPAEELARRVGPDPGRPLLTGRPDRAARLAELAEVRRDAYVEAAHVEVDTTDRPVDEVAEAVLALYRRLAAGRAGNAVARDGRPGVDPVSGAAVGP